MLNVLETLGEGGYSGRVEIRIPADLGSKRPLPSPGASGKPEFPLSFTKLAGSFNAGFLDASGPAHRGDRPRED